MQNNDALCSPHKLCSESKPNGNICSADNKYYDILGIKGNFLEALQVQKKDLRVCPVQSICSAGCSPISHFLCSVSASGGSECMISIARKIYHTFGVHLLVQKYFLQCKISTCFSGNPQWKMAYPALLSPIFPSLPILINYVTKRFQFGIVTNHKGVIYTRGRKG